jgi:ABC-type uncharacterized transport system auxiliary subunit
MSKMKKRLFSLTIAILLLATCLAHADSSGTIRDQAIGAKVTEHWTLPVTSENASSVKTVASDNQVIILRNPTFQELKDFILKDPTSRNTFVLNKYECRHFATDVNNNAEAAGLRCAFVLLCYRNGQHAVVAFDTTDRGMIYIEPQTDAAIQPEVGGTYQGEEIIEILIGW